MSFKEVWKDIQGYEKVYQISNHGRVRVLPHVDALGHHRLEHMLKPDIQKQGYLQVTLYKDGIPNKIKVHRLVARAFLPNPKNYPIINHKDENPANNHVNNLEWCTMYYNNMYHYRNKRIGRKLEKPIFAIYPDGTDEYFDSARKASVALGLNEGHVSACLRGELKHHHKFSFEWCLTS